MVGFDSNCWLWRFDRVTEICVWVSRGPWYTQQQLKRSVVPFNSEALMWHVYGCVHGPDTCLGCFHPHRWWKYAFETVPVGFINNVPEFTEQCASISLWNNPSSSFNTEHCLKSYWRMKLLLSVIFHLPWSAGTDSDIAIVCLCYLLNSAHFFPIYVSIVVYIPLIKFLTIHAFIFFFPFTNLF